MIEDFIETYKQHVTDELCDALIALFEQTLKGKTSDSQYLHNTHFRTDYQIALDQIEDDPIYTPQINSILDTVNEKYRNKYLTSLGTMRYISWRIKLQKTPIGGGFHSWHSESMEEQESARILVWTIFLNDMPEGEGDLEFINYHKKIRPHKGDVLVFPAAFTHTHRGNPPLTTEKYIATGWWYLTR